MIDERKLRDENDETRAVVLYIAETGNLNFKASIFVDGHGDAPWGTGRAHKMRVWVENMCIWKVGEIPANLQTDLTRAALDDVNWDAVVEQLRVATDDA